MDDCSVTTGSFDQVSMARRTEEKYLGACVIAKFRGYSSVMVHGCISRVGKGHVRCTQHPGIGHVIDGSTACRVLYPGVMSD
jgi:hypothetical protein